MTTLVVKDNRKEAHARDIKVGEGCILGEHTYMRIEYTDAPSLLGKVLEKYIPFIRLPEGRLFAIFDNQTVVTPVDFAITATVQQHEW